MHKSPRSVPFQETRSKRSYETAEDYTELIYDLIEDKGEARTCAIAKQMGVSHVTAIKAIKRLVRDGYVETAPHQPIHLTEKGQQLAIKSKEKHKVLLNFLVKIGVPLPIAEADVEGIEHYISDETLEAIRKI